MPNCHNSYLITAIINIKLLGIGKQNSMFDQLKYSEVSLLLEL